MNNNWYIESREGETWSAVSKLFGNWLEVNTNLSSFGYSEGDSFCLVEQTFLSFCFPEKHGENIGLFQVWGKTTDRIYGVDNCGVVALSDGSSYILPVKLSSPLPSWLSN